MSGRPITVKTGWRSASDSPATTTQALVRKKTSPGNKPRSLLARIGRRTARALLVFLAVVIVAITSLRWINPVTSSVIMQQNIVSLAYRNPLVEREWISWDEMSKQLPLAVVASEDQRFPEHRGIDFTELEKAIEDGGRRGASTITQQVAKNMFLWQGRSYLRKAIEAVLAVYIDLVWGKQRVLEIYLNIVYFGDNIYGVQQAALVYFNKSAAEVNRYEAARLASVLPNPRRYSAVNSSEYIVGRQQWILGQMKQLGGTRYIEQL